MHFSVGQFTEEYLQQAPIGIMKNEEGKVIAFCTLMPTYYNEAISVDLIRWLPDLDLPLMDGLYLHMLLWGKDKGYKAFNMGMATLSNVGQLNYSYPRERVAGRVFEHFNGLYRFQDYVSIKKNIVQIGNQDFWFIEKIVHYGIVC